MILDFDAARLKVNDFLSGYRFQKISSKLKVFISSFSSNEDILNGFQVTERTALYSVLGIAVFHERSYVNRAIIGHTTYNVLLRYLAFVSRCYSLLPIMLKIFDVICQLADDFYEKVHVSTF